MNTQEKEKPTKKARVNSVFKTLMSIHWWMTGFYLVLFCTGTFMSQLPREFPIRSPLYDFHKSIGTLVMGLLTWRILVLLQVWWRKYTKKMPKYSTEWLKKFALHTILYIFMWAVPITGFYLSNSFKVNNVSFFGLLLPDMFPENKAVVELARGLHFWFSYTFLAFIILHTIDQRQVVKALWRRFSGVYKKAISK